MTVKVDIEILKQLPPLHTIIGSVYAEDMEGKERHCLIVRWLDYSLGIRPQNRKALFCAETGEYITEF
jgi:hypothetical protein